MEDTNLIQPRCVASTGVVYNDTVEAVASRETAGNGIQPGIPPDPSRFRLSSSDEETDFFRSAQWSPDGTCILTNNADNRLRTFVLPVDLLSNDSTLHHIEPYSILPSPTPAYALAPYPFFSLSDPSTTLFLSSPQDLPIRLSNALCPSTSSHTYPLIHPPTERFIAPHSLLFTSSGTHFIAGSDSLLSVFDVTRDGQGPVQRLPTVPSKKRKIVGGGVGMKGVVSALSVSCDGVLAAGTFTRWVGLYGDEGRGDCIAVFPIADALQDEGLEDIGGNGITQTLWSRCGRHLSVVERMSDGVLLYDVRVTGKRLGWLRGRKARTSQRMSTDVTTNARGEQEVWAGGTDGYVRVWRNPWEGEGRQDPVAGWKAHGDVVSSTLVHPSGTVVATCSGSHHPNLCWDDDSSSSDTSDESPETWNSTGEMTQPIDNSLKIWTF